ncbi:hypothetical protein EXIGLDRAFT_833013 [Exidia glandulosa HHB12029]|uniref:Uncharacterized protein n=1 Tax=Exidia glandulosa HHB12029 TaxID=1314781 RepID=A0A165L3Y8_EXIGL|nr:hypothetical protein EXIGLDRAFT_833013 [Exidia glandulosa HHB12029]
MADKLANETLAAILAYHLAVPDAEFACSGARKSPFASNTRFSASHLLLVNKRWLCVATPLLYETVVIRTNAQARVLAAALKRDPGLSRFIRKLRFEGGYCNFAAKIVQAAPNVTDFAIALDFWPEDNVVPLCDVLSKSIKPQRLIIACFDFYKPNKNHSAMEMVLAQCIQDWTCMHTVALAGKILERQGVLWDALTTALHVQTIELSPTDYPVRAKILSALAEQSSAKTIRVGWSKASYRHTGLYMFRSVEDDLSHEANAKVQWAQPPQLTALPSSEDIPPSRDASWTPMRTASAALRSTIWTKIFLHLLEFQRMAEKVSWEERGYNADLFRDSQVKCMLVCKEWMDTMLPLASRDVTLRSAGALVAFQRALAKNSIAPHVRSLQLSSIGSDRPPEDVRPELIDIISQLHHLHGYRDGVFFGLDSSELAILAHTAGTSLASLEVTLHKTPSYQFPAFPALRKLRVSMPLANSPGAFETSSPDSDLLPALEELELYSMAPGSPFIDFLATLSLPLLRTFVIGRGVADDLRLRPFYTAHGASLTSWRREYVTEKSLHDVLTLCPNIRILRLSSGGKIPTPDMFALEVPQTALEEIWFPQIDCIKNNHYDKKAEMDQWYALADALDKTTYPSLKMVVIPWFDLWPATPHELGRSPMPAFSKYLADRGIQLVDCEKVAWKPRLRARGGPL